MPGGCPPLRKKRADASSPPPLGAARQLCCAPAATRQQQPRRGGVQERHAIAAGTHGTPSPTIARPPPPCPESALPVERPQPVWHPYLPPVPLCRAEYGSALGTWCSSHAVHHLWQGRLISARRTARSSWRARDDDARSMRRARRTRRAPAASRSAPAAAAAAAAADAEAEAVAAAAAEAALLLLMLL